jgi:hypothetical protein
LRRGPRLPSLAALAALALTALLGAAGCQTVDLGAPPSDVNVCEPGQEYFVSTVWPMYLSLSFGGKHCFDTGCHSPGNLPILTLTDISTEVAGLSMPYPNPLPPDIVADYEQASQEMNCSDVADSKLLIFPENIQTHGGGQLIDPNSQQAADILTILMTWVSSP